MKRHRPAIHMLLLAAYLGAIGAVAAFSDAGGSIAPLLWAIGILAAADLALDIMAERAGIRNLWILLAHWCAALPALFAATFATLMAILAFTASLRRAYLGDAGYGSDAFIGFTFTAIATIAGLGLSLVFSIIGYYRGRHGQN